MTPEQRKVLEVYRQMWLHTGAEEPVAVDAALAEIDALRKEVDDLDKFIDHLDKIIEAPRQPASRACVVEDAVKALVKDRERLDKLDLWAEMPDEWARASGKRWSWSHSDDDYDTLREAIDARAAKQKAWVGEPCQS